MSIEIDATAFAKAAAALSIAGFEEDAGPIIALSIRDMAVVVRRRVRQRAPYRSGKLRSKVTQEASGVGFDFIEKVKSGGSVAHLVAGGVRPHNIVSQKPMPIMKVGGIQAFAQAVQHPGFRADPYFHKGVDDARASFQPIIDKAAQDMVDALKMRITR